MKAKILSLVSKIAIFISLKLYINLSYLHNRGEFPNLRNPKNVSEIILSNMYSGKVNEYSDYVDKIKVRNFYKKMGYEQYYNIPHKLDNRLSYNF